LTTIRRGSTLGFYLSKGHVVYEENPYAVPDSAMGSGPVAMSQYPTDRFYVDGELIMCSSPVALPAICVVTGETEDIVLIKRTVTWVPKWIYFTLLAGLLVLAIVYLILRKECKTTYYLSRRLRNRKRWMIFGGFIAFFGGFVVMIVGGDSQIPQVLVPLGLVSLIGALVLFVMGQLPISAKRQERGTTFWLKRFKPPFFEQLRAMYANAE
jgi:hypothetical protein